MAIIMGSRLYRNDISNDISNDNAHSQYASLNLFPCYTRPEPRLNYDGRYL